eukprot:2928342-Rhodomonas_salina.2
MHDVADCSLPCARVRVCVVVGMCAEAFHGSDEVANGVADGEANGCAGKGVFSKREETHSSHMVCPQGVVTGGVWNMTSKQTGHEIISFVLLSMGVVKRSSIEV